MPDRILVIVSCSLMYFQYPDGHTSKPYVGHFCDDAAAVAWRMREKHRRAWKEATGGGVRLRASKPLPRPLTRRPAWSRGFPSDRRGWR